MLLRKNFTMNFITQFIETHQYITNIIVGTISALFTAIFCNYWLPKRREILVKQETAKIEERKKRKEKLEEIYPKLDELFRKSALLSTDIFDPIAGRINKDKPISVEDLKNLMQPYLEKIYDENDLLGLKEIGEFQCFYNESALFISPKVKESALEAKDLLMQLYHLVRNEIDNNQYLTYSREQLVELIGRAGIISNQLKEHREEMSNQMKGELDPRKVI